MPNYKLTLKLLNPPATRARRALAIAAANDRNVTGQSGLPLNRGTDITDNADGTVTWRVSGAENEVCAMITDWVNYGNVQVTESNPKLPCVPTPT
jgi:hypothetical protein